MTMIASFATQDYALMVSDLRRTNMNDLTEFYDDCPKTQKINDNILVGYSGNAELAKNILNFLTPQFPVNASIEFIASVLKRQIEILSAMDIMKNELDVTFHLVGTDETGQMSLTQISQFNGFDYKFIKPLKNEIKWTISYAGYDPEQWLSKRINNSNGLTLGKLKKIATDLILHTSKKDKFVSPKCEIRIIEL